MDGIEDLKIATHLKSFLSAQQKDALSTLYVTLKRWCKQGTVARKIQQF